MTSAEIYQWMENPQLLTKSSLMDLKQMVEDYPYFHAAKLLYLKNLAVLDDVRFNKELTKMAVSVPDRKRLFMLIHGEPVQQQMESAETIPAVSAAQPAVAGTTGNAPEEKAAAENVPSPKPAGRKKPSPAAATSDYANWLAENAGDIPAADGKGARLRRQDLIDSFIESENKLNRPAPLFTSEQSGETPEDESQPEPESAGNETIDDSYFTETLAHVYAKQKRYDKALEIIRAISLKYPEKSIYFADQIRYLEKIINNKK